MSVRKKVKNIFDKMKYRTKMIVSFFVCSAVAMLVLMTFYYQMTTGYIYEEIVDNMSNSVDRLSQDMEDIANRMKSELGRLTTDWDICEIMAKDNSSGNFDEQLGDYKVLMNIMEAEPRAQSELIQTLYFKQSPVYLERNYRFQPLKYAAYNGWYNNLDTSGTNIYWTTPHSTMLSKNAMVQVVSCARKMRGFSTRNQDLGIATVSVRVDDLRKMIQRTEKVNNCKFFLTDLNGIILACDDEALLGYRLGSLKGYEEVNLKKLGNYETVLSGERTVVSARNIGSIEWKLYSFASVGAIHQRIGGTLSFAVIVILVVMGLLLVLDIQLSARMTGRIEDLLTNVLSSQDTMITPQRQSGDEIGMLTEAFNEIVDRNESLVNTILKEGIAKKEAKLNMLQAQINSHFLYNSLDVVNWMAIEHGAGDVANMVQLLAKFYRISLSKGEEVVQIRSELEHVRTYLEIEKIRFGDDVSYSFEVDDAVSDYLIVKLVLQPIVENAIVHGLMEREENGGTIQVRVLERGEEIVIEVENDSEELSAETLEVMNGLREPPASVPGKGGSGYGLKNIRERLDLYFGGRSSLGFTYSSGRVLARIVIPKEKYLTKPVE